MRELVPDEGIRILVGDVREALAELDDASVDCIVTSPPYADARPDVPAPAPADYPDWLEPVLRELLRIVDPAGSLLLNLGRLFRDGEEQSYAEESARRAVDLGWKRIDTLVWRKVNANARGGPYLHDCHEYVYWLARSATAYRGFDETTRRPYSPASLSRFGRIFRMPVKGHTHAPRNRTPNPLGARPASVFDCAVGVGGNPHPTPMPVPLALHLVALACPPGGLVLDPFAGSGTTLVAARRLGRRGIGIELSDEWAEHAAYRCARWWAPQPRPRKPDEDQLSFEDADA